MNIHMNELYHVGICNNFTLCCNILNDFNINMFKKKLLSKQTNYYMQHYKFTLIFLYKKKVYQHIRPFSCVKHCCDNDFIKRKHYNDRDNEKGHDDG
jgi:hypothetical protein